MGNIIFFASVICVAVIISYIILLYQTESPYRQPKPAPGVTKLTKFILAWNPFFGDKTYGPPRGQRFSQCPVSDCFVTADRKLVGSVSDFDAILFHLQTLSLEDDAPDPRSLELGGCTGCT